MIVSPLCCLWGKVRGWLMAGLLVHTSAMVQGATPIVSNQQLRPSLERAIEFLGSQVPAWPHENQCFSCHHQAMARVLLLQLERKDGNFLPKPLIRVSSGWRSWKTGTTKRATPMPRTLFWQIFNFP